LAFIVKEPYKPVTAEPTLAVWLLELTELPDVFVPPFWLTVPVTVKTSSELSVTFPEESAVISISVSFSKISPLLLPVVVPETAEPPFATVKVEPSAIYPVSFVVVGASFTPVTFIVSCAVSVAVPSDKV